MRILTQQKLQTGLGCPQVSQILDGNGSFSLHGREADPVNHKDFWFPGSVMYQLGTVGHKPDLTSHLLQKPKKVSQQPARLGQALTPETQTFYSKPMVVIPKPGAELKGSVLSEATTFGGKDGAATVFYSH